MTTFGDGSVAMASWQELEHDATDGHTYVKIILGSADHTRIALAVRRRLHSLSSSEVTAQAAAARDALVRVLRQSADALERGVVQS